MSDQPIEDDEDFDFEPQPIPDELDIQDDGDDDA